MSTAALTGCRANCSGAIHDGVPMSLPVAVVALASQGLGIVRARLIGDGRVGGPDGVEREWLLAIMWVVRSP
jgi:hypothetical protein